eukprot:scaffold79101_cov42-Prasinocladus_malaysianus.AAC.1
MLSASQRKVRKPKEEQDIVLLLLSPLVGAEGLCPKQALWRQGCERAEPPQASGRRDVCPSLRAFSKATHCLHSARRDRPDITAWQAGHQLDAHYRIQLSAARK